MKITEELQSGSSPRIRKAAEKISKKIVIGHCSDLVASLKVQITNPRSWQTQSAIIRALGKTDCQEAIPYLKELVDLEFKTTKLYSDLGFSICLLEKIESNNLNYFYQALATRNLMLIAGACSAILYTELKPQENDIIKIIENISSYIENEDKIISPRTYIAFAAYKWPASTVKPFLESCKKSKSNVLVEIAESSLKGEKSRYVLV